MLEDKNEIQVRTSIRGPSKKKVIPRERRGERARTYDDVISTRKCSNEREK